LGCGREREPHEGLPSTLSPLGLRRGRNEEEEAGDSTDTSWTVSATSSVFPSSTLLLTARTRRPVAPRRVGAQMRPCRTSAPVLVRPLHAPHTPSYAPYAPATL